LTVYIITYNRVATILLSFRESTTPSVSLQDGCLAKVPSFYTVAIDAIEEWMILGLVPNKASSRRPRENNIYQRSRSLSGLLHSWW